LKKLSLVKRENFQIFKKPASGKKEKLTNIKKPVSGKKGKTYEYLKNLPLVNREKSLISKKTCLFVPLAIKIPTAIVQSYNLGQLRN